MTVALTLDAFKERLTIEQNQRAWMVWHIAALMRAEKLPRFERMLSGRQRTQQSWQEQMAVMGRWASVMRKIEGRK